jgi:hypothetical protein
MFSIWEQFITLTQSLWVEHVWLRQDKCHSECSRFCSMQQVITRWSHNYEEQVSDKREHCISVTHYWKFVSFNTERCSCTSQMLCRMGSEVAGRRAQTVVWASALVCWSGTASSSLGCAIMEQCRLLSQEADSDVLEPNVTWYFYLWVLHPVAHPSNWFLVIPSITTKFQYVTPPFLSSFTHYMFQPLRAILRWGIQLDILKDYFYYNGSVARTQLDVEMLYA